MTDLDVAALGARIRLDFADDLPSDRVERVRESWRDAALPGGDADEPNATVAVRTRDDLDLMEERLTVSVTLAALEHRRGEMLLFHAGGVATDDGKVFAFVGPSGRGKTTLSRALSQQYGYVSDETIAIDGERTVHPYRKPLSVVREKKPKQQIAPSDAGMHPLPAGSLRAAKIALIDRGDEFDPPQVDDVGLVDAIVEIVPQMSYLVELPRPLQTLAELIDATGGVVSLRYREADAVSPLVSALVDRAPSAEEWQAAPVIADSADYDTSAVIDALQCGDRTLVLIDRCVQVLAGIAPIIWDAARQGKDFDETVAQVVAVFGAPPEGDAHELVDASIDELVSAGVLARR